MAVGLGFDTRTAHKQHPCAWCHEVIAPGDRYIDARFIDNGVFNWREHEECAEAEQRAFDFHGNRRLDDEPACCNVDIDGGSHDRGRNCPECSDMPVRSEP